MNFSRRRFIGAIAAGSAGMIAPRGFAEAEVGVEPVLLPRAMAALETHWRSVANRDVIGMVDFGLASHEPRFHLVDISKGRVLATHLVAHRRGSDPTNDGWVERFSNHPGSNASCSGSFVTGDSYTGKHGRSRRLIGLDPSNNLADSRGIIIHAASYVDSGMALSQGRIGRSQGCFAVSHTDIDQVLSQLGPGRLLYAWK